MGVRNRRISTITILSLLGTIELIWLFYSDPIFSEIIFLFIVCTFSLIFSSLSVIDDKKSDHRFYSVLKIGLILEILVFILLI